MAIKVDDSNKTHNKQKAGELVTGLGIYYIQKKIHK